jgi:hypothetical protein
MNNGNHNDNQTYDETYDETYNETYDETGYLIPRFEDYKADKKIVIRNRICMIVILILICVFIYFVIEYYI